MDIISLTSYLTYHIVIVVHLMMILFLYKFSTYIIL